MKDVKALESAHFLVHLKFTDAYHTLRRRFSLLQLRAVKSLQWQILHFELLQFLRLGRVLIL